MKFNFRFLPYGMMEWYSCVYWPMIVDNLNVFLSVWLLLSVIHALVGYTEEA